MSTPEINASQGYIQSVTSTSGDVDVSNAFVLGIFNFPSPEVNVSDGFVQVVNSSSGSVDVAEAFIQVVARGRIENPRLSCWKFKLDAHELYVVRLGENKTLLFDMLTKQWSWWASPLRNTWRPSTGLNWREPGDAAATYGSNVVCGDDTIGVLWILNPNQGYDDVAAANDDTQVPFFRRATAQIISRGRNFIPVFDVFLTGTPGEPAFLGASVSLKYSDDGGMTFVNAGTLTVNPDDFTQEFAWRSLGRIQAPGRIFQIEDDGAFARIDGLDVNTTVGG